MSTLSGLSMFSNERLCEILGITATEAEGLGWSRTLHPDDREMVLSRIHEAAKTDAPFSIKHRLIHKNGEVRWVLAQAMAVKDERDQATFYVGTVTDITELKNQEESLRQLNEKLRQSLEDGLQALAAATEMRDPYTAGHQQRVAELACSIASEMGLSDEQIHAIRLAGVVHDIGKIHIPAEILAKPTKLSPIEFELLKAHAQAG